MPIIYDKEGNKLSVPDETAARLLKTGEYTMEPGSRINVAGIGGKGMSVSVERYLNDDSLSPLSAADEAARMKDERMRAKYDTLGGEVKAFVGGGVDALSFGYASPFEEERKYNPVASILGTGAGIAATMAIPGAGAANAARAGGIALRVLAAERAAAGAVAGVSRLAQAGSAVSRVVGYTPLGLATKLGAAAGNTVKAGGVLGRAGATAVEGAVGGTAMEVGRAVLDDDHEFSGEALLGAIAVGGAFGAVGSLASSGITKGASMARRAPKAVDESAMLTKFSPQQTQVPAGVAGEWGKAISLGKSANGAAMADAVTRNIDDLGRLINRTEDMLKQPGAWANTLKRADLEAGLRQARSAKVGYEGLLRSPSVSNENLVTLARSLHGADELAARLRSVTDDLPARWTDDALRARLWDDMGSRLNGKGASAVEEAANRIGAQLGVGLSKGTAEAVKSGLIKTAAGALLSKVPGGQALGKVIGAGGGAAGTVGAVVVAENLIQHGVGALVGSAASVAIGGAAAVVGAKVIQKAFKDPHVGGLLSANATHVLSRSGHLPGQAQKDTTDPRRALRDFADRTRRISPEAAAKHAVEAAGGSAAMSPSALAMVGQAAARRHALLRDLIERIDPQVGGAGALLGRPLPSAQAARQVADFIRAAGSPTNFLVAALDGRLTPEMMAAAEQLWPSTVAKVRAQLLSALVDIDPSSIPQARLRALETILGPQALGGPSRSDAYRLAMAESAARTSAGSPPQPPRGPSGPTAQSELATPAMRAARPGQDK